MPISTIFCMNSTDLLLAYVDPGSAGFIIVSVLGFLSAVGYTLRNAFGRLASWLRRRRA